MIWSLEGVGSFSIKKGLFVMTLTEHLTQADFDLRSKMNASLTLEMNYLVHLDQTSPREFVFSVHLGPKMTWSLYGVKSF